MVTLKGATVDIVVEFKAGDTPILREMKNIKIGDGIEVDKYPVKGLSGDGKTEVDALLKLDFVGDKLSATLEGKGIVGLFKIKIMSYGGDTVEVSTGVTPTVADIKSVVRDTTVPVDANVTHNNAEIKDGAFTISFDVKTVATAPVVATYKLDVDVTPFAKPVVATVLEDGQVTLGSATFGIFDDSAADKVEVIITGVAKNGTLYLDKNADGVLAASEALAVDAKITQAEINKGGLIYKHNGSETKDDKLTFSLTDGKTTVKDKVIDLNVTPVNDVPVVTIAGGLTTKEDTTLAISGITLTDVDGGTGEVTLTITAKSGKLIGSSGLNVIVEGSNTSTLTLKGTVQAIESYLSSVKPVFAPDADANGDVALTVTVTEGQASSSAETKIVVTPVDDAPIIGALPAISTAEDSQVALAGIAITDVDAGENAFTVTLKVAEGKLIGTGTTAVTVTGNDTGEFILKGKLAAINAYLKDTPVKYEPALNATGDVKLTVTVGEGEAPISKEGKITITPVNDAPTATSPATLTTNEDTAVTVTGVVLKDVDIGAGVVTVTLTVPSGTLAGAAAGTVTVTGGDTGTLTLKGTLDAVNTYLAGPSVTFTPAKDASGEVVLKVVISDGEKEGTSETKISVTAVNDGPTLTPLTAVTTAEDTNVALTGITIADVDSLTSDITVTLNVTSGTLIGSPGPGVTVTGSNSGTVTLKGNLKSVTDYLKDTPVNFAPAKDASGPVDLKVTVSDGIETVNAEGKITVTAVNDAPTVGKLTEWTTDEDKAVTLTGITVDDIDLGAGILSIEISSTEGSLTATTTDGPTFTGSGSIAFKGTVEQLNAYLKGGAIKYLPKADFNGVADISIKVSDGKADTTVKNTVKIASVVDIPDAQNDAVKTTDTVVLKGDLYADNGSGADLAGDGFAITKINGAAPVFGTSLTLVSGAILKVDATGKFEYNPNGKFEYLPVGATATDTFTYELSGKETATVTVTINGVDNNDRLTGKEVAETLSGGLGNDTLIGTAAANQLDGGAGDDLLVAGLGQEVMIGGVGIDTVDYRKSTAGVTVDLTKGTGTGGSAQGDKLSLIENVLGTAFVDEIIGNDLDNVIAGLEGADKLFGGLGIDTLDYSASKAGVQVNLANGKVAGGDAAGDTISGFENVTGSAFNDVLTGSTAANILAGGAGVDRLNGGSGNDKLYGDAGNDVFVFSKGKDVAYGGEGDDMVRFAGKASAYKIVDKADGSHVVIEKATGDRIALFDIEQAKFANKVVDWDAVL